MIRWADTAAVPRNVFVCNGRIMLVFLYNKATTKSNKSFYIAWFPCPVIERVLVLYLVYVRPFSDFLVRQLKIVHEPISNPRLFTVYDNSTACFSSAACSKSLEQSTPESSVRLNIKRYRQIAVSIAKKHIPDLLQPFDPNIPRDYDGFLRLLSFQTGHKPSTHASAYVLDRACSKATWWAYLVYDSSSFSIVAKRGLTGATFSYRFNFYLRGDTSMPVRANGRRCRVRLVEHVLQSYRT